MTRETFSNLILDSEPTLYRVAMSMLRNEKDCEDAVQTAILTAFEKLGMLRREEYFKTWLVRILINVCNKQLKSAAKTAELHDTDISSDSAEASTEIRMAIESLPVKIRQVVVLYYIEQFTVKEIKQILKIPEGTVKSCRALLHRAIHRQGDKANPENSRGHRQKPPEQRTEADEKLLNRMKITPVAETQQGIISSF